MPSQFETVGDRMLKWEPAADRELGPLVTPVWATQAKIRKKCCYERGRTWVNIAVYPCLHSFLTHNKHHLFENKVSEIYIFIRSVFVRYWSHHYSWLCFRSYLYHGYTTFRVNLVFWFAQWQILLGSLVGLLVGWLFFFLITYRPWWVI